MRKEFIYSARLENPEDKMKTRLVMVMVIGGMMILFSNLVLADFDSGSMMGKNFYRGMMCGYGWGMGIFGGIFMVLILVVIILFIIWLVKELTEKKSHPRRRRK